MTKPELSSLEPWTQNIWCTRSPKRIVGLRRHPTNRLQKFYVPPLSLTLGSDQLVYRHFPSDIKDRQKRIKTSANIRNRLKIMQAKNMPTTVERFKTREVEMTLDVCTDAANGDSQPDNTCQRTVCDIFDQQIETKRTWLDCLLGLCHFDPLRQ